MFCKKCGNGLREGANFCSKCGTSVGASIQNQRQEKPSEKKSVKFNLVIVGILGACIMCVVVLILFSGRLNDTKDDSEKESVVVTEESIKKEEPRLDNSPDVEEVIIDNNETEMEKEDTIVDSITETEEPVINSENKKNYFVDDAQIFTAGEKAAISATLVEMNQVYGKDFFVIINDGIDDINEEEYIINMYEQNGYGNPADKQAVYLFIKADNSGATVTTYGQEIGVFSPEIVRHMEGLVNLADYSGDNYVERINKFLNLCKEQLVISKYVEVGVEFGITTSSRLSSSERMDVALFLVKSTRQAELFKGARTGGTIIMSMPINADDSKSIKLAHIHNNTLLKIGDFYDKSSLAYSFGGANQAITMLNTNLDMEIVNFVALGCDELANIVDYLGGLDLVIDIIDKTFIYGYTEEREQLATGLQHLNGEEVSRYCLSNMSSYPESRSQNQIEVLNLISQRFREMDTLEYNAAKEYVYSQVYSNMSEDDVMRVFVGYSLAEKTKFPYSDMEISGTMGVRGAVVCSVDLVAGVKRLHYELFGTENYRPTNVLGEISEEIDSLMEEYFLEHK